MNKGYIVDFVRKTITITAEFEKAMRNPEAEAYKVMQFYPISHFASLSEEIVTVNV